MVLGEEQPVRPVEGRLVVLKPSTQQTFLEQLLLEPDRHRHAERPEATRREGDIGLEQALKLQERLVVEGHVVDGAQADAGFLQAIGNRGPGKAGIVLLAGEPLLLRRGDDAAIVDQVGGAVVIERGDSEYPHGRVPGPRQPRRSCR